MKKEDIFYESGQGLVWCEFEERGCPAKKEDYFLTKGEILELGIVKKALASRKKELLEKILKDIKANYAITAEEFEENYLKPLTR